MTSLLGVFKYGYVKTSPSWGSPFFILKYFLALCLYVGGESIELPNEYDSYHHDYGIKPVVSLYAYSLGRSQEISMIIASSAIFPAILALQIGKWVDHIGTRPIVIIGNVMFMVALLLSAIYPSFLTFLIQLAMVGMAATCLMLCLQKRIGSLGVEIDRAVANYSLFGSIGAMIGPTISSYMYDNYGYQVCIFFNISLIAIVLSSEMVMRNADGKDLLKTYGIQQSNLIVRESIWTLMRNRDMRNAMLIGG